MLKKIVKTILLKVVKVVVIGLHKLMGPPQVLNYNVEINVALLRAFDAQVGAGVIIHPPVTLLNVYQGYDHLTIGDKCVIHGNSFLDLSERITLESGVSLGPGTTIMTHNRYNFNAFLEDHLSHTCGCYPVIIKRGSGVKAGALVTMGVTIGEDAVVAGGAVVNRDVDSCSFVAGVPARLIKMIGSREECKIHA